MGAPLKPNELIFIRLNKIKKKKKFQTQIIFKDTHLSYPSTKKEFKRVLSINEFIDENAIRQDFGV